MQGPAVVRRVVVLGYQGVAVGRAVGALRGPGVAVAGFVGDDEAAARAMALEMLGGVDEVLLLDDDDEDEEDDLATPGASAEA